MDYETGGLDCRRAAVTEIAAVAVRLDNLQKIDMVNCFVQPYGNYTYEDAALKATGITHDKIQAGIPVKEAVQQLIDLFKKADLYGAKNTKPILVAHNSGFDKGFLIQLFHHCNKLKELEKLVYGKTDFHGNFSPECIDSVSLSQLMWGNDEEMVKYNLASCVTKAGIELNDAHSGIQDTLAMKDMVCTIIQKMRSGNGSNEAAEVSGSFRQHFQF